MHTLFVLSVMIFAGMAFGRLAKLVKLPNVTGYLIAGLLLGPAIPSLIPGLAYQGIITSEMLPSLDIISEVALGFIAFSIGNEFKLSYFKRVGATPIVIAVFESLFAILFVLAVLLGIGIEPTFAIVLSSIAAATAPAATIMVINQYKAKGPVTETLLSVVAIDDATALAMFSVSVAVAQAIKDPSQISIKTSLLDPLWEIFGALIFGVIIGMIFCIPLRWFKKDGNRLSLIIAFVFLGVGLSGMFGFSSLLMCMAIGAGFANFSSQVPHIMKLTDGLTPPIFMLFFVLSGAELQLSVVPTVGLVGVVYVVMRVIGKMCGTAFGGMLCKADKKIRKYLGPALMPQAGVAIGLSLIATQVVPEHGAQIRAIILCGTLIYELIGPVVTKISLTKAGEITASANTDVKKPDLSKS